MEVTFGGWSTLGRGSPQPPQPLLSLPAHPPLRPPAPTHYLFHSFFLRCPAPQLPTGSKRALPYVLTVLPPLGLSLSFPGVFLDALDFAGTYGVLVLFGLVPAAMAWSERYCGTTLSRV